jgi:hypothetical protein
MLKRRYPAGNNTRKKKKKDVIMKRLTLCVGDHFPVACHRPFVPESLVR